MAEMAIAVSEIKFYGPLGLGPTAAHLRQPVIRSPPPIDAGTGNHARDRIADGFAAAFYVARHFQLRHALIDVDLEFDRSDKLVLALFLNVAENT